MSSKMLTLRRWLPIFLLVLVTGCATHAGSGGASPYLAKGETVRILPLGDSITRGSGSGYGNYRRSLQFLLTQGGDTFQFVGTNTEQSFNYHGSDPEQNFNPYQPGHEGYGGFRIDQIASDSPATDDGGVTYPGLSSVLASDTPNVILLMLGTNDVKQGYDPGGPGYGSGTGFAVDAAARLDALIDRLFAGIPNLTLVVAAITPLADPAKDAQAQAYNALIPQIVAAHKSQGQNILFADMHSALTAGDLSPDGVHPGTRGYDKMARVWYQALTGQTPLPLPPIGQSPGRLDAKNIFSPSDTVTVSNTFAGGAFSGANLIDGTNKAFVFGDAANERVSISGFARPIGRLRFFDTPSYTGRTPGHVTIYYSKSAQTSLNPADYISLGTFTLTTVGDAYENPTQPAAHPNAGESASHPAATIGFYDLAGFTMPVGSQSVLLNFSKSGGDGDGLTEIQAFAAGLK